MSVLLVNGDALHIPLADKSVHCVVTSPPYYGLRSYGIGAENGEIGLEESPDAYTARMVEVFREVKRVLRDDGTLFLNLGDSYAGSGRGEGGTYELSAKQNSNRGSNFAKYETDKSKRVAKRWGGGNIPATGALKNKDLIGIPWMVAFALRADGWYLRSDIIWSKPNPMPESVTDRPSKSHEYIFLLSKSARYLYDAEAVKEPAINAGKPIKMPDGMATYEGGHGTIHKDEREKGRPNNAIQDTGRNKRSVWTIATYPTGEFGRDKAGTVSEDCPIHGLLARSRTSYTLSDDGRQAVPSPRIAGNSDDRGLVSSSELKATNDHNRAEGSIGSARAQTLESKVGSRILEVQSEHTSGVEIPGRTMRSAEFAEPSDRKTDYSTPSSSETARVHSKQKSKTDRALESSRRDTSSAQTLSRTPSTSPSDGQSDLAERKNESSISRGDSSSRLSVHIDDRNADKSSYEELYCTCSKVSTAHFATYPAKLVEPCIKAGTSERGCCSQCGTPWVRVTEKQNPANDGDTSTQYPKGSSANRLAMKRQAARARGEEFVNRVSTVGWQPGCKCDAGGPVPCTVLDPFSGSGTTAMVARALGRNAVGLDLSMTYIRECARPRLQLDALDAWQNGVPARGDQVSDLPMFAEAD